MKEEIYPSSNKMQAKVILGRCPYAPSKSENLFGMRIQKMGSDWVRTWAFKIDSERAHNEGYDRETTQGSFVPASEYPGCPYCGSDNFCVLAGKHSALRSRSLKQKQSGLLVPGVVRSECITQQKPYKFKEEVFNYGI
ncbi:hypothetical protein [uncultured Treponema sp.]|uniref:hypothetical protein n=1 Tax=uncultured Treponema sp. TaxID=162155 RepID=UPI00258F3099|nr:hypothetical protein [uncultured Treponema sp.]